MKKSVLLFPGQGSQYVGMGKKLYKEFEIARQTFEEANDVLGFDLKKVCFEGSMEELTKTENTQPVILTTSMAAFRVYMKEIGIKPSILAGHSLGEISALTCSGAINFRDGIKIVKQRGKFMQEAVKLGTGSMAAICGIDKKKIEYECRKLSTYDCIAAVSNYNSPDQTVISGHKTKVLEICEKLASLGARVIPLKVSAPFHSVLMQHAAERLRAELKKYEYEDMEFSVMANVTALPYDSSAKIVENLTKQLVQPVQWQATIEYLVGQGIELSIEIGPNKTLKNFVKAITPKIQAFAYDDMKDVEEIKSLLVSGKNSSEENRNFNVLTRCMAMVVCTKNYNWDNDEYNKGVIEPYKEIKQMQEKLENEGKGPTDEQVRKSLELLRTIFLTKKTPIEEQKRRFRKVLEGTDTAMHFADFI